ncbi:MAG: hypothetical protein IMX04_05075 [Candidatus Carbobacillus altaicus]|nr:hypothetical protein [Candidatus Carbobacillus altaicus]
MSTSRWVPCYPRYPRRKKVYRTPCQTLIYRPCKIIKRAPIIFRERIYRDILVTNTATSISPQSTALQTMYTFAVINRGMSPVQAHVEISPDGVHWAVDSTAEVAVGETGVLVPKRYLRYTRLTLFTVNTGETSTVNVYFQTQSAA